MSVATLIPVVALPAAPADPQPSTKPVALAAPDASQPPRRLQQAPLGRYYPRRAIHRRLEGKPGCVAVAADGSVQEIVLVDSQPPGVFEAAAKRAAKSLRYAARPAGSAVVWVDELFVWQLGR